MSTEMKTGLVLSGGGAVGAYQAGVVKALAECGAQISMVSGASIGALNGAIIAASPDLSEAAARLEALWKHLGENQVLSVNRSVYFSLLKKLFQAMNLCQMLNWVSEPRKTPFFSISRVCPTGNRKKPYWRQPRCPCCSVPARFREQCTVMVGWADGETGRGILP